jgi:asparagine synthase (glutamine-hydrolysing)
MTGQLAMFAPLALGQIESTTYLRNQLLRDSDWASMDHSVEIRTPLVDAHLLAALQSALPSFDRYSNKRLLAEAPETLLPREILERRKTGFGIPVGRWLAETSQVNAEDLGSRAWAKRVASSYDEQL